MDSDHTPDGSGTASQQGGEAYVIVEPPLFTDYAPDPSHTQGSTYTPVATESVHIARASSIAGPHNTHSQPGLATS